MQFKLKFSFSNANSLKMSSPAALKHVQNELYNSLLHTISLKVLTFTVFLSAIDVSSDYVQGYLLYQANEVEL